MANDKRNRLKRLQKTQAIKLQEPEGQMKLAARWPLTSCLISNHWQEAGHLIEILVTRTKEVDGLRKHVVGLYLVDLGCLGLKNTFGAHVTPNKRQEMVDGMSSHCGGCSEQPPERAAMIVKEAIAYARSCGFEPNADYKISRHLIADITPADETHLLKFGDGEGKPLYVAGPHDNPRAIVATLEQKFGPEGFKFAHGHH